VEHAGRLWEASRRVTQEDRREGPVPDKINKGQPKHISKAKYHADLLKKGTLRLWPQGDGLWQSSSGNQTRHIGKVKRKRKQHCGSGKQGS